MIKIGNCGWSYLNAEYYFPSWKDKLKSKLQVYAKLFDLVEINSTFYAIPQISTVKKWREEVDEINDKFEFTIKVSHLITHKKPFSDQAFDVYEKMKELANELRTKILIFQSPSNFKPSSKNLEKVKRFFEKIERNDFIFVWEVRWANTWTEEIVKKIFSEMGINQCVDPFRQECFYFKDLVYYRLHGLGKASMYNYNFSLEELKFLSKKLKKEKKPVYILFNNAYCYENALQFAKLINIEG